MHRARYNSQNDKDVPLLLTVRNSHCRMPPKRISLWEAGSMNTKMTALFVVVVTVFCSSACMTKGKVNKTMASWQGHHYTELLAKWGPPQQVLDDGSGGRVLTYTRTRSWSTPGQATTQTDIRAHQWDNMIWGTATSTTTYTPGQSYGYTSWRMFFINSGGRIYKWSWRGL
jgi:hypothetical protein